MSDDVIKNMEEIRDKLKSRIQLSQKPSKKPSNNESILNKKSNEPINKPISYDKLKEDLEKITIRLYSKTEKYKASIKLNDDEKQKIKYVEEQIKNINKFPFQDKSKLEAISHIINALTKIDIKDYEHARKIIKVWNI